MKRQIRQSVFETNSSSTHSLTITDQETFEKWKNGELLFSKYKEKFVDPHVLSDEDKEWAKEDYERDKDEYTKDWNDLSEEAKEKYYMKYAEDNDLIDEDVKTYADYMHNGYLETFVDTYTTKSGDKVVAFGQFGYDG